MKIKCIKSFRDKTTAENIKNQTKIKVGDILTCDEKLAKERIKKGFALEVVETSKVEETEVVETPKKAKRKKGE